MPTSDAASFDCALVRALCGEVTLLQPAIASAARASNGPALRASRGRDVTMPPYEWGSPIGRGEARPWGCCNRGATGIGRSPPPCARQVVGRCKPGQRAGVPGPRPAAERVAPCTLRSPHARLGGMLALIVLAIVALSFAPASAQAGPTSSEILQLRIGQIREGVPLEIGGEAIASTVVLPDFYERRGF